MAPKKNFYAVAAGRKPGIYRQWFGADGAHVQVEGFAGAVYKGFVTLAEAEAFMANPPWYRKRPPTAAADAPPVQSSSAPAHSGDRIVIYTDGSALNNPGPGGYGVIIEDAGGRRELSAGFRHTTNNRMELLACITGLDALKEPSAVALYSDSQYVINGVTKNWARGWRRRGWKKSDGAPALNPDLWERLLDLCDTHDVQFVWVKGHAGNPGNERCDQLAVAAASGGNHQIDSVYERSRKK
ncbi:MAG: ribonuclease HI [Pseudomonadota bacterium]